MQIHIPKPCSESWEQMAPRAHGRYCNACEKTVVDFTRMSDAELIAFLKNSADQTTCGRLRNDQIDRPLILPVAHCLVSAIGLAVSRRFGNS
jgi:predicted house-cleaning NTP pyrophosphatase (Maf/HAM1 superfamily)